MTQSWCNFVRIFDYIMAEFESGSRASKASVNKSNLSKIAYNTTRGHIDDTSLMKLSECLS